MIVIILSRTFLTWRRALSQGPIWTAAVWALLWGVLYIGGLVLVGAGTMVSAMLHPGQGVLFGHAATATGATVMVGGLVEAIVGLGAGPFLTAGVYGILSNAVRGDEVSWSTFWTMAVKLYGRSWGIVAYFVLYVLAAAILYGVGVGFLGIIGVVIVSIAVLASLPWPIRMAGALFVDRASWAQSFRQSFHGRAYGAMLLGIFLMGIAMGVVWVVVAELGRVIGAADIALFSLLELALTVVVPVWFFGLYQSEKPLVLSGVNT